MQEELAVKGTHCLNCTSNIIKDKLRLQGVKDYNDWSWERNLGREKQVRTEPEGPVLVRWKFSESNSKLPGSREGLNACSYYRGNCNTLSSVEI